MKSDSGFDKEVRRQRNKALVWNFALPLLITVVITVVIIAVVNICFYRYEVDTAVTTAESLSGSGIKDEEQVRLDYPGSYVLYFDEEYELIEEYGNPSDFGARPDKLSNPSEISTISIGESSYVTATRRLEVSEPDEGAHFSEEEFIAMLKDDETEAAAAGREEGSSFQTESGDSATPAPSKTKKEKEDPTQGSLFQV